MKGQPFYLEALSFDQSKNQEKFRFKKVVDSLQDARNSFQPVSCNPEEAALRSKLRRAEPYIKKLQETVKESTARLKIAEETVQESTAKAQQRSAVVAELANLVGSTLTEHEKLENHYREETQALQQQLAEARRQLDAALQFEISTQCCVCKSELVQIVGGQVRILHSLKHVKDASVWFAVQTLSRVAEAKAFMPCGGPSAW